ncbi:MAG: DegT/DnrJ/EryC1/StrS family aminotransferase [Eubacteriales bacterium]
MDKKLAVKGGRPVRGDYLPGAREHFEEYEISAVNDVLRDRNLRAGQKVDELEERFAAYAGAKYAVAVSNGGAGLHIAAAAAGVAHREEVILSPLAPPEAVCCALYRDAAAVFADIDIHTYNMDPEEAGLKVAQGTSAIVAVHFAGQPCDMDKINSLAKKHNLAVIEDATRALGAEYRGRRLGSLSDLTVFSFRNGRGRASNGGGAVTTDSEELYHWLKLFRNYGIADEPSHMLRNEGPWYYEMQEVGFPYLMSDIQAAIALSCLDRAEESVKRREEIARQYSLAFAGMRTLTVPGVLEGVRPAWSMYVLSLRLERLNAERRQIYNALQAENIGVAVHYPPLHRHPFFVWQGHKDACTLEGSLCQRAEDLYETLISLPVYPAMKDRDVKDVIDAVLKVVDYYS